MYQPILPQGDRYHSQQLGLDLRVEGNGLRFLVGSSPVLDAHELISSLERRLDDVERRADGEPQLDAERRLREDAEEKLAAALAEIARLTKGEGT